MYVLSRNLYVHYVRFCNCPQKAPVYFFLQHWQPNHLSQAEIETMLGKINSLFEVSCVSEPIEGFLGKFGLCPIFSTHVFL